MVVAVVVKTIQKQVSAASQWESMEKMQPVSQSVLQSWKQQRQQRVNAEEKR